MIMLPLGIKSCAALALGTWLHHRHGSSPGVHLARWRWACSGRSPSTCWPPGMQRGHQTSRSCWLRAAGCGAWLRGRAAAPAVCPASGRDGYGTRAGSGDTPAASRTHAAEAVERFAVDLAADNVPGIRRYPPRDAGGPATCTADTRLADRGIAQLAVHSGAAPARRSPRCGSRALWLVIGGADLAVRRRRRRPRRH